MRLATRLLRSLHARLERVNEIDRDVRIGPDCWISGSVLQGRVTVGDGCKLFKSHVEGEVAISRFTSLWGPGIFVAGRVHGVSIGSFCSVARYVSIQEDNHNLQRTTTYFVERNLLGEAEAADSTSSRGRISIGNDVWIGAAAQVLSGVAVGDGAVIAAGAIVTADVPPYAIVAGNPARIVRYRFEESTISRLLADAWWDWPLDRLREEKRYLLQTHARPE